MTPEAVEEKYGLTPAQYPDYAALRGDPSDNLPSIPGVGEKTAVKLIQAHGTLDALLDVIEEMRLLQPSSSVQVSKKNPDRFVRRAAKIILRHILPASPVGDGDDGLSTTGVWVRGYGVLLDSLEVSDFGDMERARARGEFDTACHALPHAFSS